MTQSDPKSLAGLAQRPGLAPFATRVEDSRGRVFGEPESPSRTLYQRDRDRVIHSAAFRRLKYKTQVFVYHEGDYYRTRLSHSLEVSQIARSVCRVLALDEDMAEALALAHDLGHPPFGHAGEDALNAAMAPHGGFDHNAQALRIVTHLEQRYGGFDGLNLTWETLEGLAKHNGPVTGPLPHAITDYPHHQGLELDTHAGPEAQVAALSDDIAYNNHDIDDGLRAGLFSIDDLAELPLVGPAIAEVRTQYPEIAPNRLVFETIRRLISRMIEDMTAESRRRIARANPQSAAEVRGLGYQLIGFSEQMQANDKSLKDFLRTHMYRHPVVNEMSEKSKTIVAGLFAVYLGDSATLPEDWRRQGENLDDRQRARLVADFIAGMTDRFAIKEHDRLCGK